MRCTGVALLVFLLVPFSGPSCLARDWDMPAGWSEALSAETHSKLSIGLEFRGRYESRSDSGFVPGVDIATGLYRTRLRAAYTPFSWLKIAGSVQDSRAPWYGLNAPVNMRDSLDLAEGWFELFPSAKTGFGMSAGRTSLTYGEGRLLGTAQWSNANRTFDQARVYYRLPYARFEFLFLSPVKVCADFNRPVLGDRAWGIYNVFPAVYRKHLLEAYVLRHDQNRPGGFAGGLSAVGTDRLRVNSVGSRLAGPFLAGTRYGAEFTVQNGKIGPASHRAHALYTSLSRRVACLDKPLDLLAEYKFASGTRDPADPARSGTFDQIYGVHHDRFGHEDLFGARNIRNVRLMATLGMTRQFAVNLMYDDFWLASRRDALYNGAGRALVRASSASSSHVGQEADVFATYRFGHLTLGAGYGHIIAGNFLREAAPAASPSYFYVFHSYGF